MQRETSQHLEIATTKPEALEAGLNSGVSLNLHSRPAAELVKFDGELHLSNPDFLKSSPFASYEVIAQATLLGSPVSSELLGLLKESVSSHSSQQSGRQIADCLKSVLLSEKPSELLEVMAQAGVIARDLPEIAKIIGVQQDPQWHPEGDVWQHTKQTVDMAVAEANRSEWGFSDKDKFALTLGALLHDNGKFETTRVREKDGRIVAPNHEQVGVKPAAALLDRIEIENSAVRDSVLTVVGKHMIPPRLHHEYEVGNMNLKQYEKAAHRQFR